MTGGATRDLEADCRDQVLAPGSKRHGLVIGIKIYRDERLNLRYADADARAMYELMVDPACGLFPKDKVTLLVDADATKENIWKALSSLRSRVGPNDEVWIYFAGHGAVESDQFYWVAQDTAIDDLYGTALLRHHIDDAIKRIQAKRIIIFVDCCHAHATSMRNSKTRDLPALSSEEIFGAFKGKALLTIAASDGLQKSVELDEFNHGAFTYYLKKGLRGEADSARTGIVTVGSLWSYLETQVEDAARTAHVHQTPVFTGEMTHGVPLTMSEAGPSIRKQAQDRKNSSLKRLHQVAKAKLISSEEMQYCVSVLEKWPLGQEVSADSHLEILLDFADDSMAAATLVAFVRGWNATVPNPGRRASDKGLSERPPAVAAVPLPPSTTAAETPAPPETHTPTPPPPVESRPATPMVELASTPRVTTPQPPAFSAVPPPRDQGTLRPAESARLRPEERGEDVEEQEIVIQEPPSRVRAIARTLFTPQSHAVLTCAFGVFVASATFAMCQASGVSGPETVHADAAPAPPAVDPRAPVVASMEAPDGARPRPDASADAGKPSADAASSPDARRSTAKPRPIPDLDDGTVHSVVTEAREACATSVLPINRGTVPRITVEVDPGSDAVVTLFDGLGSTPYGTCLKEKISEHKFAPHNNKSETTWNLEIE